MGAPKFRYAVIAGVGLGIVPSTILAVGFLLHLLPGHGEWFLYIWPTSIMLMAPETGSATETFALFATSIALNTLLYVVAVCALWSIVKLLEMWRASLRDGTTI